MKKFLLAILFPAVCIAQTITFNGGVYTLNGGAYGLTTNLVGGGGPVSCSYVPATVSYDGSSQYLHKASDLTGDAAATVGTCSFWIKLNGGDGVVQEVIINSSANFIINRTGANTIGIRGKNSSSGNICIGLTNTTTMIADGLWHHVYATWDAGNFGNSWIAIDGSTNNTFKASGVWHNENITYTDSAWDFANFGTASKLNACIAEFWFDRTYHAATPENIALFRDGTTHCPQSLGTTGTTPFGTQPIIYWRLGTPGVNSGSGGNFTATGSPGACGSTPP